MLACQRIKVLIFQTLSTYIAFLKVHRNKKQRPLCNPSVNRSVERPPEVIPTLHRIENQHHHDYHDNKGQFQASKHVF